MTDYRQNLFKQIPYDAETSAAVIDILEEFGDECKRRHGKRIIYPSDEWYLKAGRPIPDPEFYEDYDQLGNGGGHDEPVPAGISGRTGQAPPHLRHQKAGCGHRHHGSPSSLR